MPHDPADSTWARSGAITSLTDNSGGTADNALAAVEATYTQATIRNNFADVTAKINAILTALREAEIIVE